MILKYLFAIFIVYLNYIQFYETRCYDDQNQPIKCSPEFVNIAYNLKPVASNTCGDPPTEFCTQTALHHFDNNYSRSKVCDVCNSNQPDKAHPVSHLTDYNSQTHVTWWQSETMLEGIQYPNSVNLTLNLEKSFEVTYIQVKFHSPRPESFAIYKKTNEASEWIPYQYYSASCEYTYGFVNRSNVIERGNEAVALCTDEYSDIAPLTGASVAFSTLEGRPSAYSFDTSDELKEWVTATDIKIVLNRLNTFGDEVFRDPTVLKSYFYAISDISVGGRCKCNGHADRCEVRQGENFDEKLKCECQHNTDGTDCERCLPFYNDVPWAPATWTNPQECKQCDCNGMSNKCFFDRELYEQTGHGGHCVDCQRNTAGVHCEHCKETFYRSESNNECIDCQCHPLGSESLQCDPSGKCRCKRGVTGLKCDRCESNYFDLTSDGCKPCNCSVAGSFDSPPICDSRDGKCRCKANVEGQNCDRCKPGFFNLEANNNLGCLQCFCNGHTSDCKSSDNHAALQLVDGENKGVEWNVVDAGNEVVASKYENKTYSVYTNNRDIWFNAPSQFLGNHLFSYTQSISFELKFRKDQMKSTRKDIILENSQLGLKVYRQLRDLNSNGQQDDNSDGFETFTIKLKETEHWIPSLTARDFQRLLTNLTAIRIKASLSPQDYTHLRNFKMESAKLVDATHSVDTSVAHWVEKCTCPPGYTGQFCESCLSSYKREVLYGDSSVRCIPCSCNNHSNTCNEKTGHCDCLHYTTGEQCERCLDGYYGNALTGTSTDCKKCSCPNDGQCAEIYNYQSETVEIVCLNCPEGTQGNLCEQCEDGYFLNSTTRKCQRCGCNGNIDENAIGNCDNLDGKCLRCVFNTTGNQCENCLSGYWGNALTSLKCHACDCFKVGTNADSLQCSLSDGQCSCKPHVIGRQCNKCEENYWNITSGNGCVDCKCDPLGSHNLSCNTHNGQCNCKPGVVGLKCDKCAPNHYDFSDTGCKHCNCDPSGSESLQCDEFGRCKCKEFVVGTKCNACEENRFNFTRGCLQCDDCYNLVQRRANELRGKTKRMDASLESYSRQQSDATTSDDLSSNLERVRNSIDSLHNELYNSNENDIIKVNYTESVRNLVESLRLLNADFKAREREYDSHRKKFEDLERLTANIGNSELELSGIKLILENVEAKLQEKNITNRSGEKSRIQALAESARESSENSQRISNEYKNRFNDYIENLKVLIGKVSFIPDQLQKRENALKNYELSAERVESLNEDIRVARERLKEQSDKSNNAIKQLLDANVYNPQDEQDADKIESFAADIHKMGVSLKSQIDALSKSVNQFVTLDFVNGTAFARNALTQSQLKQTEYKNLNELVQNNKNLADSSIKSVNDIQANLTSVLNTLDNFNEIYDKSKLKAQQAKQSDENTNENLEKTNKLLQEIKDNMQQIHADVENVRSKNNVLSVSIEKMQMKLNNMKDGSSLLQEDTNKLLGSANSLSDSYRSTQLNIDQNRLLHNDHPKIIETQHKKAEGLITNVQNLSNRISSALDSLSLVDESQFLTFSSLTSESVQTLENKYDSLMRSIEERMKYDEEIEDLEIRNQKLTAKLTELESVLPLLNDQVDNLNEINKNLVSNQCFSKKTSISEEDGLRNV